jgi:D-methionine transport system substrate-binding protein
MLRIKCLLISLCCALLFACGTKQRGENEIYIGTISGPETELMMEAKKVAQQRFGLDLHIVTFEDYVMPNTALAEGEIDANMFQHEPYLRVVLDKKHYAIEPIGRMYIYPMGFYSKKFKNIKELPNGAVIGLPNDPSNGARALRLLAKAGLIQIPDVPDLALSPKMITANPHHFIFKEIAAAQLPRVLPELDAAAINTNFALPAGLIPDHDAILLEDKNSPYANVVVIREKDKDQEKYKKLMEALHSPEVTAKAESLFHDQAIPAW